MSMHLNIDIEWVITQKQFPYLCDDLPINENSVYIDKSLHCRYLVICYPMKAQYISTPGRAKKIIAAVWVAAIGLSVAPTYFVTGVNYLEIKIMNLFWLGRTHVHNWEVSRSEKCHFGDSSYQVTCSKFFTAPPPSQIMFLTKIVLTHPKIFVKPQTDTVYHLTPQNCLSAASLILFNAMCEWHKRHSFNPF